MKVKFGQVRNFAKAGATFYCHAHISIHSQQWHSYRIMGGAYRLMDTQTGIDLVQH
jgi:hypothetical protein